MKAEQAERVIRNSYRMFGTRDSDQKIGGILQRVRSGEGAKSCRSEQGERVDCGLTLREEVTRIYLWKHGPGVF